MRGRIRRCFVDRPLRGTEGTSGKDQHYRTGGRGVPK